MSGEMRRPPQLWEQRLARTTSVLSVGLSSGGDTTAVVPPAPPPGSGGGVEPAPVLPPPGAFIKPSTPQLVGGLQGINVLWDGLNSASELWPYDTSWVEVHMSTTGTAFTPGTATLKGRLARPGSLFVGGLTAGSAYYFKLRGADPAGNYTEASDAATGFTGLTTASDYGTASIGTDAVSFNARTIGGVTNTVGSAAPSNPIQGDVWLDNSAGTAIVHKIYNGSTWVTNAWGSASIAAGQITALQIAAGAVTAGAIAAGAVTTDKLTAGTITGFRINGGTISGGFISGGTVSAGYITSGTMEGTRIQTGTSGSRVELGTTGRVGSVDIFDSSGNRADFSYSGGQLTLAGATTLACNKVGTISDIDAGGTITATTVRPTANVIVFQGYRTTTTAGDIMLRLDSNVTTTAQAKFQVEADGDVLSRTNSYAGYSDRRLKENIEPARDYLDDLRQVEVVNFNWIGSDQKLLGVIAQQIQPIFPNMVAEDQDGTLSVRYSVFVPMLLTAVQSLADKVDDLTARIEALEA